MPRVAGYNYTPYVSLGIGGFLNMTRMLIWVGKNITCGHLGTEGQGSALYPDRKPYNSMAVSFPLRWVLNMHLMKT